MDVGMKTGLVFKFKKPKKIKIHLKRLRLCIPGQPENTVKGGTTVSGGSTVLSRILQQSFSTHRRPWRHHSMLIHRWSSHDVTTWIIYRQRVFVVFVLWLLAQRKTHFTMQASHCIIISPPNSTFVNRAVSGQRKSAYLLGSLKMLDWAGLANTLLLLLTIPLNHTRRLLWHPCDRFNIFFS